MKKKIYWCIQNIDEIGGTEMVSTDLMNHLVEDYDITCIVTSKPINKDVYSLNENIKRFYLNVPHDVTRFDAYLDKYKKEHKIFKIIGLSFRTFFHFFFKRKVYSNRIKKLIKNKEDVLIASSADSYLFAPRGIYTIFHFHFDSKSYFSLANKILLGLSRKPDHYLFLSDTALKAIESKDKKVRGKSSYLYNPLRFEPCLDVNNYNNRIIFAGRFNIEKDPMFTLEIANELKNRQFQFVLDMFGNGPLMGKMKAYINQHALADYVHIHDMTLKLKEELIKSDLLLITSKHEGFGLVKIEANSQSTPVVSTNVGDITKEIYHEGIDGFIIDSNDPNLFADKVIEILSDKEGLIKLKETSFRSSFNFTYDSIISNWKKLLN